MSSSRFPGLPPWRAVRSTSTHPSTMAVRTWTGKPRACRAPRTAKMANSPSRPVAIIKSDAVLNPRWAASGTWQKKYSKNYNILFLTWYFNTNLFTFSKSIFRVTLFCWFTVERRRGSWRNDLVWQASRYRKRFRFRFSHYLRKTRFQPSNLFQKEQGKYLFFYSSDIFKFSEKKLA